MSMSSTAASSPERLARSTAELSTSYRRTRFARPVRLSRCAWFWFSCIVTNWRLATAAIITPCFDNSETGRGRTRKAAFRIRQRTLFVVRVQIRARDDMRLTLVEIRAQPDVPVRQSKHRLGLRERVHVQRGLGDLPRLDW